MAAPVRARAAREPRRFVLPNRDWDRATELIRLVIATGRLANAKAQSVVLIADPGSGKSELLDRFKPNKQLEYAGDLTVQGLYPIIRRAQLGHTTHIVATEFQKFFLRRAATAQNTLGTLCQFMEEGVGRVLVGQQEQDFGGAQGGLIAAMTSKTAVKWEATLAEYGFWSRCAAFSWEMSQAELVGVMGAMSEGNTADITPLKVSLPKSKVDIHVPKLLSQQLVGYVNDTLHARTPLRFFLRLRALAMASALLDGRDRVHARDIEKVAAFEVYWRRTKQG